jgi:hypothetical protein
MTSSAVDSPVARALHRDQPHHCRRRQDRLCSPGRRRCSKSTSQARIIYITQSERLVRQAFSDLTAISAGPADHPVWRREERRERQGHRRVHDRDAQQALRAAEGDKWFSSFMVILFDEVHHAPSESAQRVLEAIPAFFRLGATDSIKDADEARQGTMIGLFGPIRNRVETHEVIAQKTEGGRARLARPHIYLVDIKEWRNKFRGHWPAGSAGHTRIC